MILERIIEKYRQMEDKCDFVLCECSDYEGATAAHEFEFNQTISTNLGCPVLMVGKARGRTPEETVQSVDMALLSLKENNCQTVATIVCRADPRDRQGDPVSAGIASVHAGAAGERAARRGIHRETHRAGKLHRAWGPNCGMARTTWAGHVDNFVVAAMQLRNFLPRLKDGTLVITPRRQGGRTGLMHGIAVVDSDGKHCRNRSDRRTQAR